MTREAQRAILHSMQASPATEQFHHGRNLYPYKFVMSRIVTHKCVTLNVAYK